MRLGVALAAILAVGTAGSLNAQTNTLKDPPPSVQTVPLVLGEVTNVTSHSVVVRTTRGETMTFETDSRTVMPTNLVPGRPVKIEFHLMENGTHHAGRITVIETGSKDWDQYEREISAVPSTNQEENETYEGGERTSMSTNGSESSADELPATASPQPLLLGLGLTAAALGLGLAIVRRRRIV